MDFCPELSAGLEQVYQLCPVVVIYAKDFRFWMAVVVVAVFGVQIWAVAQREVVRGVWTSRSQFVWVFPTTMAFAAVIPDCEFVSFFPFARACRLDRVGRLVREQRDWISSSDRLEIVPLLTERLACALLLCLCWDQEKDH